jgi:hypothetical protein
MIDIMMDRKRHISVGTVYRAGRSKNQVFYLMVPAAFENIDKADKVRIDIGLRISQRISDTGLGSKIDHDVKIVGVEKIIQSITINQI